jgi:YD repeat-containing protein
LLKEDASSEEDTTYATTDYVYDSAGRMTTKRLPDPRPTEIEGATNERP